MTATDGCARRFQRHGSSIFFSCPSSYSEPIPRRIDSSFFQPLHYSAVPFPDFRPTCVRARNVVSGKRVSSQMSRRPLPGVTPGSAVPFESITLSQSNVKILNSDRPYTSQRKASFYVKSGRAIWEDARTRMAIWFLPEGQLIATMHEDRAVSGSFAWYVGDSGGSSLMKAGTARGTKAGVSGGYRVLKAQHGDAL
jgi:hypothetical protein